MLKCVFFSDRVLECFPLAIFTTLRCKGNKVSKGAKIRNRYNKVYKTMISLDSYISLLLLIKEDHEKSLT